jgi:hypothetical protein
MTPEEKLDQLAEFQAQRDALKLEQDARIEQVFTPAIRDAMADIEFEFKDKFEAVDANIAKLTEEVKADVIQAGATVKGSHLMAVFNRGRVSWDTKKLDGMMIVLPQLAEARKEGDPSVAIRKI